MATIANPPTRRTIREFRVTRVCLEAARVLAAVDLVDSAGDVVREMHLEIHTAYARGIAYSADGGVEKLNIVDPNHAGTAPVAAYNSFAGTAGNFAAKVAAFEAWCQSVGLLPA